MKLRVRRIMDTQKEVFRNNNYLNKKSNANTSMGYFLCKMEQGDKIMASMGWQNLASATQINSDDSQSLYVNTL